MKKILAISLAAMLLISCKETGVPKGVMDEETMTQFLKEAYLLEGYYAIECGYDFEDMAPEISKSYEHLLEKYEIDKGDLEKSIAYYLEHDDIYKRIHDQVVKELDEEMQ